MKNIKLFALLLILSMAFTAAAQVSAGLRVGVTVADQTFTPDLAGIENQKPLVGFTVVVPVEIKIIDAFAIQPEIGFKQSGTSYDYKFRDPKTTEVTTLNYLDFQVLAKYIFGGDPVGLYVDVLPVVSYALSGTVDDGTTKTDIEFDTEKINRVDFGLGVGAGVEVMAGPGNAVLDLRYIWGLLDINDYENYEMRNQGFAASVGYMFRF